MEKSRRDKFLEQGRCTNCGKSPLYSKVLCKHCADKMAERSYIRYKSNKETGLCGCGNEPEENYKTCRRCINEQKQRNKKNYEANKAKRLARYLNDVEFRMKQHEKRRKYTKELRVKVIEAYGGKCAHCGESNPLVLQIDHIHNDGYIHRKINKTYNIYSWLKAHGFPKDNFQLLCANCNWCKGVYGVYPDGGLI